MLRKTLNTRLVNPHKMTKAESIFVGLILEGHRKNGTTNFKSEKLYAVDESLLTDDLPSEVKSLFHRTTHVRFSYMLSAVPNQRSVTGNCFYLLEENKRATRNSIFVNIAGVLQPQPDGGLVFKANKRRLAKSHVVPKAKEVNASRAAGKQLTQEVITQKVHEDALNEYELSKRNKLLSVKPVFSLFDVTENQNYLLDKDLKQYEQKVMIMRSLHGKDLQAYLQKESDGHMVFTLDQRLQLSRQLMQALIEQVQMQGIIHRDINPNNIRVNLKQPGIGVTIFDYGTAVDMNAKQDLSTVHGTPKFMAPEVWGFKKTSFAADVYSMAWVLAMLWRADKHSADLKVERYQKAHLSTYDVLTAQDEITKCLIETANNCKFQGLFKGMLGQGLSIGHRRMIKHILDRMVNPDPTKRCSADDVVDCFSQIISNRRIVQLPRNLRHDAFDAYDKGIQLRKDLQLESCGRSMLNESVEMIKKVLGHVTDKPGILLELTDAAGLLFLNELKTKQEMLQRLNQFKSDFQELKDAFDEIKEKLNELSPALSDKTLQHIQRKFNVAEKKYAEPRNLQEAMLSVIKLKKYVLQLTHDIDQFCSKNVTGPSLQRPTSM